MSNSIKEAVYAQQEPSTAETASDLQARAWQTVSKAYFELTAPSAAISESTLTTQQRDLDIVKERELGATALTTSVNRDQESAESVTGPQTTSSTAESLRDKVVPGDLLDLYFQELGKVSLLTAEQEVELAQTIEAGREAQAALDQLGEGWEARRQELELAVKEGSGAYDHFVAANLRLVVSVAAQFSKRSQLEFGELIQEGNLGLLRAVEKFDWRRGYKFSTYATWWIRQAIQRGVAGSERTIRLPVAVHDAAVKIRAAGRRLESETGREATVAELAEATRLTEDMVRKAKESDHVVTSLDKPVGFADNADELGDFVAVSADDPAEEAVNRHYLDQLFDTAAENLSEREWYVLRRRFGLDGLESTTLDALGRELGLSRETVRKTERGALEKLRKKLGVIGIEKVA